MARPSTASNRNRRRNAVFRELSWSVTLLALILLHPCRVAGGPALTTLLSFQGANGANPLGEILVAADGTLFGTTSAGGAHNQGTLFRITATGEFFSLASFAGTNGANPQAGLISDPQGGLYGTTYAGGAYGFGTVFRATANGEISVLGSFDGANGGYPKAPLVWGLDGLLYGTAAIGGASFQGVVFRSGREGGLERLASLDSRGFSPYAPLLASPEGGFYGTVFQGGSKNCGAILRVTPDGSLSFPVAFGGSPGGANPSGAPIRAKDGHYYGTTCYGGSAGWGAVYRFTAPETLVILASFAKTNGAYPVGALLEGNDGHFYGVASAGGAYSDASGKGYGTVFRFQTNGTLTTLVSFGGTNGAYPQVGLTRETDGSFLGTTQGGGVANKGTVFRLNFAKGPGPTLRHLSLTQGVISFDWQAEPGRMYEVQYRADWGATEWIPLEAPRQATAAELQWSGAVGTNEQRFYRVVLLP